MANESLQQMADRGVQVYNGQQYSNTSGNQYTANAANQPTAPAGLQQGVSAMTLGQAQNEAERAFSGLVAPMTQAEITAREEAAKALTAETASSIYNPTISREKQTGAAGVSTAEGVVGQRQGFNISTAEQAFVADVQNKVQDRVREVENIKASYISQGNLAAADRADSQLQALNEWNSQMTIAKANYALQIMAGSRDQARLGIEQARLGLEEKAQAFDQTMAEKNLAINIAGLTGEYDGSPTFAATQAKINNALSIADLTGYYNGKKTLEAVTTEAQLALQKEGVELNKQQLQETIRSNRAQESLSYARLSSDSSGKVVKTPTDVTNETVARLTNLRNSGQLNDANYAAETRTLAAALGYDQDTIGELQSIVNRAMEGDNSAKSFLLNQSNQAAGSDFQINSANSRIESEISSLKSGGTLKSSDIRYVLKQQGFSDADISKSSIASLTDKASNFANKLGANLY